MAIDRSSQNWPAEFSHIIELMRADVRPSFTEQIIGQTDTILADAAVTRWNEGRE